MSSRRPWRELIGIADGISTRTSNVSSTAASAARARVSCSSGLGSPDDYYSCVETVPKKQHINRQKLSRRLIEMQYPRTDYDLARARFRVRGDTVEIMPAYEDVAIRIEFFGADVERIVELDPRQCQCSA